MASFKEIVTKAVIGKGKKTNTNNFTLTPENSPSTILGCWVINHTFSGTKHDKDTVNINGSFDINVWYSYDNDKKTAVTTENFSYIDTLKVPLKNDVNMDGASEIIVRCLRQPTVSKAEIEEGRVVLDVEREMGVEIVGDEKMKISVEEDEDDYDEVIDEEDLDSITDEIDDNYLDN